MNRPLPQPSPVRDAFAVPRGHRLLLASTLALRRRAWALVHRAYRRKGFAEPDPSGLWYGVHDALPGTTTALIARGGVEVATLTQVFDSALLRLPADALYADELEILRGRGRRLCEIVSLACESGDAHLPLLMHLFRLIVLGAQLERATDLIITVNPRHAPFYLRMLLFERIGAERAYGKVAGAPALLLRLDLTTAAERLLAREGSRGRLYAFFFDAGARRRLEALWRAGRRPLPREALRPYFDGRLPDEGEPPTQSVCAGPNGPSSRFRRVAG